MIFNWLEFSLEFWTFFQRRNMIFHNIYGNLNIGWTIFTNEKNMDLFFPLETQKKQTWKKEVKVNSSNNPFF